MDGEIIKSFLVGLGFSVNDADLKKFNSAIQSATVKVTALYAAINVAAAGIVAGISDISEGFEKMGYEYHIIAPAINKALVLRRELLHAYSAAGINITKVIQASVKLNMSLAKTKFAFEAIYKSVGSKFFGLLTKQSDLFRQKIYANMPKIQLALEHFVKFVFKAFEGITQLGLRLWSILSRVYEFFVSLDKATDGWSTIILGVIAAWKLLNLSFLATPLGMIIAGLVAILALFDDFKTYQEGGKSLFNWGPVIPIINDITAAFQSLWEVVKQVAVVFGFLTQVFEKLFKGDWSGALQPLYSFFENFNSLLMKTFGLLNNLVNLPFEVGGKLLGLLSNSNAAANIQGNPGGPGVSNPIGSNVQNSNSNQHVQQQTNINVIGAADAQATGKAVSGEQSKVNFDLVRNLRGATR